MFTGEERGLRARSRHRALVRPLVESHRGEAIEATGDESLSVFSTVLDTVRCALAIEDRADVAAWRRAFEEQGYPGIARAALQHEIGASGRGCTNDPVTAGWLFAALREPDRMFACVDESERLGRAVYDIKVNPAYDPYRSDPRFTALLRRMNLAV